MKKLLGKYLFEVIVIFIGITGSFIFEEWRQSNEREKTAIRMMESLVVEISRNNLFVSAIDSTYQELNASLQKMIDKDTLSDANAVDACRMLMEGISQIRLKEISSFIHGFSSSDQLNILNKNKEILRYLSYLESLLSEHEAVTNAIDEYSSSKLWPLLIRYSLADDVLSYQKELLNNEETQLQLEEEKMFSPISDSAWIAQIQWSQLKVLRLIQINQAIHMQIENVIRELNNAIESA